MITDDFDVFVKRYKDNTNINRNRNMEKVKEKVYHVNPKLTITPISADTRNKANIDYVEQMERVSNGLPLVWDDSKFNQSTVKQKIDKFKETLDLVYMLKSDKDLSTYGIELPELQINNVLEKWEEETQSSL